MFPIYRQLMLLYEQKSADADLLKLNPFAIELLFWVLVLALTALFLKWQPQWLNRLEAALGRLSRRKVAVVIGLGLLAFSLRLATLPWNPEPVPSVHDEFSYLLQAKTFNEGRLTNPTHPLWVHFESFHINMWPTYQSMYPVGQASFLLIGQALLGNPWIGVVVSVAVMCSAVAWMLQGWMPAPWALFGGLLTVLRFALFGPWVNSYWGGAVAATGGCLLIGAMARLKRRDHIVRNALIFAAGLAVLANTRPFEGLIFSLVPLCWMAIWLYREFRSTRANAFRALACGMVVLVPVFSGMLYYNYRSTGNPLLLPYAINHRTYHISKPFLWQDRYDFPDYNHFIMKKFYIFHELPDYMNSRNPGGLEKITREKVRIYYEFFVWPLGIPLVLMLWFAFKSQRWRWPMLAMFLVFVALLVQMWPPHGHYAAPATCVLIAALVLIFRLARTLKYEGLRLGQAFSRGIMASCLLVGGGWYLGQFLNMEQLHPFMFRVPAAIERARIIGKLEKTPGKHLVIVRTNYFSWPGFDWVYNEADIDNAKIVWARDMGELLNRDVTGYYKDRTVWEVNVDDRYLRAYQFIPVTEEELAAAAIKQQTAGLQPATSAEKRVHAK